MTVHRHPERAVRTQAPNILNVTGTRITIKIMKVAKSMIMAIVFVSIIFIPLFYHLSVLTLIIMFWIQKIVCRFCMEHTKRFCSNHDQT